MRKNPMEYYLSKIAQGVLASLVILAALFAFNKNELWAQLCLYETMPAYKIDDGVKALFKFSQYSFDFSAEDGADTYYAEERPGGDAPPPSESPAPQEAALDIIGVDDVVFQLEATYSNAYGHFGKEDFTIDNVDELRDLTALQNKFYIVEGTGLSGDLFDIDKFLKSDFVIDETMDGPKILVFHTHGNEKYADSDEGEGVIGFGNTLCEILNDKYGDRKSVV